MQADAEGVLGVIAAGAMVVEAVYFNMVRCVPYWYTQSELMTVIKVRHVLWNGLQLVEISVTNKLPLACNRLDAMQKRAEKSQTRSMKQLWRRLGGGIDLSSMRPRTVITLRTTN